MGNRRQQHRHLSELPEEQQQRRHCTAQFCSPFFPTASPPSTCSHYFVATYLDSGASKGITRGWPAGTAKC